MRGKGNIVSYTAEELDTLRARGESLTDWAGVDAKPGAELETDFFRAQGRGWQGRMNAVRHSFMERSGHGGW